ncbi:MAG TPA: site-specific integrase, partial [Holophaga sp.]|nr:site-specific integrase [Holophaga sp.]
TKRSSKLDTRTARLSLPAEERHVDPIQPGRYLIYERPKSKAAGAWLARWYDLRTKKQKQARMGTADDFTAADGVETLTYAQAQAKAREWFKVQDETARREAGGDAVPAGPFTVNAALDVYFQDGERRGMKGLDRDRQRAAAWIRPDLGAVNVADLTRTQLEVWLAKLAASPRRVRTKDPARPVPKPRAFKVPRAPKPAPVPPGPPQTEDEKRARKDSAKRVLTVLKAALNHALDRRLVTGGEAWQTVKPYRGTTSARVRFLNAEEQVRLVNACPEDFRHLVRGALLTGARYGELARLRVKDFNDLAATIFVAESKSGKPRHVVLTDEGKALFAELTAGHGADEEIFQRIVKRRKRESLGSGWGHGDASHLMEDVCAAAGLESLTFHELRHSYASMLVNAGCPLVYVAAQLGHSDTRMVEKHYGHLAPSAMANAIRAALPAMGLVEPAKVESLKVARAAI